MQTNLGYQPPTSQETRIPKVSIGMPVYNGEKYIRKALDSVLAQTYTDFELVISDNASTDGTETICREYAKKDSRIRYVLQTENRGGAANFQFVLEAAQGEYFMWAAVDDWWMPTFVVATVHVLDKNPRAVGVGTQVKFSNGILSTATSAITGSPRQRLRVFLSNPSDNSRFYGLYRVKSLRKAINGKEWGYYAGDWLVTAAICINGEILEVPEILMARDVGTVEDKYYKKLSKWNCFPLVRFSVHLLKHKEAWSISTLIYLFKMNIGSHFYVADMRGWYTYPIQKAILKVYRAILR